MKSISNHAGNSSLFAKLKIRCSAIAVLLAFCWPLLAAPPEGILPTGNDGRPLNLDFSDLFETDEDLDYTFTVAKTLGANHVTLELPTGANAAATLKKLGDWALKHQMFVAYHTHQQGSMTCFDEAFALSKGNMANVDLGHFVAATDPQGTPLDFLNKFHDRISSFHLKDRTTVAHCAQNLAWGTGETPIKEILRLVRDKKWTMPASIELEYSIPQGSDAVIEVKKCVEYCKAALL